MLSFKYWRSYHYIVKSDQLDIDSEIAEVRYKIRGILQHLGEEKDVLADLHDKTEYCLEHETDDTHWRSCKELFEMSISLTTDTDRRISELQELLAKHQKLTEIKMKQAHFW